MTEARKRTDAEVWHALETIAADAEPARIDALSDGDLDGELRAAGIDPESIAATAKPGAAKVASRKARLRARPWVWGLASAAVVALVIFAAWPRPERFYVGHGATRDDGPQRAATMRKDAFKACEANLWSLCEDRLNEARGLDPDGEANPEVRRARESIAGAIGVRPDGGRGEMP
jgi:hypothetical protein